jgi:hypothetical protein
MEKGTLRRHPSLPPHLSPEELQGWIINASVEKFTDTTKKYFTPDQIQEFEHESSANGRNINKLLAILEDAAVRIKKGNDEPIDFHIPATPGTKKLDGFRRQNDDLVEKGFEEIDVDIFGIVNSATEKMEYFTLDGNIIADRTRALSIKEQNQYLIKKEFRQNDGAKLIIQAGAGTGDPGDEQPEENQN